MDRRGKEASSKDGAMTPYSSPGAERPSKRLRCNGAPPAGFPPLSHAFVFEYVRGDFGPARLVLSEEYFGEQLVRPVCGYHLGLGLDGHWNFFEGAAGEPNVFEVVFNTNPGQEWRMHRFVQIKDTDVYRYTDDDPSWHMFLIHLPEESW